MEVGWLLRRCIQSLSLLPGDLTLGGVDTMEIWRCHLTRSRSNTAYCSHVIHCHDEYEYLDGERQYYEETLAMQLFPNGTLAHREKMDQLARVKKETPCRSVSELGRRPLFIRSLFIK